MIVEIEVRIDEGGEAVFLRGGAVSPPAVGRALKVIVCGGREFADYELVRVVLASLNIEVLIHGAARGADTLAAKAARKLGIVEIACPADWRTYGRRAGMLRNRQMLEHRPDAVIAFRGGAGTADMVRVASGANVTVYRIKREGQT